MGISIGYPTKADVQTGGLVVISASPGGPAYRAGVSSGDVILAIDDTTTENMGLYDAAERLQWVFPTFHLCLQINSFLHKWEWWGIKKIKIIVSIVQKDQEIGLHLVFKTFPTS